MQHRDKGNDTWRDLNGTGSFVQTLIVIDEMTPDIKAWSRAMKKEGKLKLFGFSMGVAASRTEYSTSASSGEWKPLKS